MSPYFTLIPLTTVPNYIKVNSFNRNSLNGMSKKRVLLT